MEVIVRSAAHTLRGFLANVPSTSQLESMPLVLSWQVDPKQAVALRAACDVLHVSSGPLSLGQLLAVGTRTSQFWRADAEVSIDSLSVALASNFARIEKGVSGGASAKTSTVL